MMLVIRARGTPQPIPQKSHIVQLKESVHSPPTMTILSEPPAAAIQQEENVPPSVSAPNGSDNANAVCKAKTSANGDAEASKKENIDPISNGQNVTPVKREPSATLAATTSSPSDTKLNNVKSEPLDDGKTSQIPPEQVSATVTTTTSEPPKKKRKKITNSLAKLLEDSMWYMESAGGSKVRESSLKIERIKEKKLDEMIHEADDEPIEEPELTPEELAKIEQQKELRKKKAAARLQAKKEKKELQKEKAKERKRLAELGLLPEKKKAKKSLDLDNIDYDTYYGGGPIAELLKASQYFTNQGKTFDGANRREVKPVERLSQDLEYSESLARSSNGKKLKHRDNKIEKNKTKTKRKYKKRVRKDEDSVEGDEYEDAQEGEGDDENRQGLKEGDGPKQDPSPPAEPEPIWFTDFHEDEIDISSKNWKFFQDFIYQQTNDTNIPTDLVNGADLIRSTIKIYRTDHEVYKLQRVDLHFPFSEYKERYLLALPKDDIQFNPFDEIGKMMELMSIAFFPPEEKVKVMNLEQPENCIVGRYINSFENNDLDGLLKCIGEFNQLIDSLRASGKILAYTKERTTFPREVVYELLNQCYLRKVLPESRKLSNYKAFSNEVYGELMPSFLSTVYSQCELDHSCCFMDLGSGVGNCVIQAALEFGCESHGVEIVENASRLGDLQLVEFESRCRIFGLKPGFVNLFSKQSFVDNPPVKEVIDRCNVILVNNYLFDTQLNKKVIELFQNLNVGTKIISLKPIVPATHKLDWENCNSILNRLKTSKFIYQQNSVSWTSKGGFYYITEVMGDILEDNLVGFKSRESRRRDEGLDERSRSDTPLNAFTNNV